MRKMRQKFESLKKEYTHQNAEYDSIYNFFEGWLAYARLADTYCLIKKRIIEFEEAFQNEISTKEVDRYIKEDCNFHKMKVKQPRDNLVFPAIA